MTPIPLDRQALVDVLADLEFLVTSLDRIGSAAVDLQPGEWRGLCVRFLDEGDIFRRLARTRRTLGEALDAASTPAEIEAFKLAMEEIRRWDWSQPSPVDPAR